MGGAKELRVRRVRGGWMGGWNPVNRPGPAGVPLAGYFLPEAQRSAGGSRRAGPKKIRPATSKVAERTFKKTDSQCSNVFINKLL